jgi:acyl-CoA thioester hydrolase
MTTINGGYDIRECSVLRTLAGDIAWVSQAERPNPFCVRLVVDHSEIDDLGHVNNTVYARWMEACAWAHSAAVGLPPAKCVELGRGMAMRTLEIEFLRPAFGGQTITVLNWITKVDRLRAERRFQVFADASAQTLALGTAGYVCIDLATGAPIRMPPEFSKGYQVTAAAF